MVYVLTLTVLGLVVFFFWGGVKSSKQQTSSDILPATFVVFDLETTGLKASSSEIIEVAAIMYQKGQNSHQTFQSLVKPNKPIPKRITEITGITQEMVDREGRPIHAVLEEFRTFVGQHRLVTFNAEFDMSFILAATEKLGIQPFNNPISCALQMARRAWPKRKSYRLDDLARDGGIDQGKSHRALEDARRALIVYSAAVAELKSVQ